MTAIVLQSGAEWGTFPSEQPVRGGGAPPTPPPRIDSTPTGSPDHMSLGLQRQLRTHAGREAPAHGALAVPRAAGGDGLPGQGPGSLHQRVSREDLFGADGRSPRRAQPDVPAGTRDAARDARQR